MARGWESKAVEGQVQEFQERDSAGKKRQLTPAQLESRRRRGILLLSRARVQKDLQSTQNPRHKEQLNRALADLDSQLAALKDTV
ncbi:MAG: hypothetical protein ACRD5M_15195 [Candidatus Acidiferrales bacterium]